MPFRPIPQPRLRPLAFLTPLLFLGASIALPGAQAQQPTDVSSAQSAAIATDLVERTRQDASAVHSEAIKLAREGNNSAAIDRLQALVHLYPSNTNYLHDLAAVLSWARRDAEALQLLPGINVAVAPAYTLEALAKSARNLRDYDRSLQLYRQVLAGNPQRVEAQAGLIYSLTDARKWDQAQESADGALTAARGAKAATLLEARAYLHEHRGAAFDAMVDYDRLLSIEPDHPHAQRKRALLLSELGAPSLALKLSTQAPGAFTKNDNIKIAGDAAASLIRSGESRDERDPQRFTETDSALDLLAQTQKQDPTHAETLRLRFDRVLALRNRVRMQEAVAEYEALRAEKVEAPAYVSTAAADAYLYLEQPAESRDLYLHSLRTDADNVDVKQGLFYSYVDLDDFRNAFATIDKLATETPPWRRADGGGQHRPNWPKSDIDRNAALARGFAEMYAESQKRLAPLVAQAPNNPDVRQAFADVSRWRGHPRAAAQEYEVVLKSVEPDHLGARIGHAYALLDQRRYREAEHEITALHQSHWEHKAVQALWRAWQLHNMSAVDATYTTSRHSSSPSGEREHELELSLTSKPIAYDWRLFARTAAQQASLASVDDTLKHYGAGVRFARNDVTFDAEAGSNDWRKNSNSLALSGEYSFSDYYSAGFGYEKSSLQTPLQARAAGVDADAYGAWVRYRASELTSLRAGFTHMNFDDGNDRDSLSLSASQRLVTRAYYHLTLNGDLYASRNSIDNAPYFNPNHDKSASVELENRWRTYRRYSKSLYQVLGIGAGVYDQDGFGSEPTASLRYQHEWRFNDRIGLDYGLTWSQRVYDGDRDRGVGGFIKLNALF